MRQSKLPSFPSDQSAANGGFKYESSTITFVSEGDGEYRIEDTNDIVAQVRV